jgi:hypothetical protein
MPEKKTIKRARRAKREGKSPSTQAGAFVHEEIKHVREGKHGARSTKQVIAIGLSKARRAGVDLPPPKEGTTSKETRRKAQQDARRGSRGAGRKPAAKRAQATRRALNRGSRRAVSREALASQARAAAKRRSGAQRSAAARKAARTRKK